MTAITPFRFRASDADLADLKRRIERARWPERETVDGWAQGVPLAALRELAAYWADRYDWRACEARLDRFGHFKTEIDGLGIHFLHARSPRADATPLILTHGWPGSVLEFLDVIGPLSDPDVHGAPGAPAFHVVVPSLPGYGFSDKPTRAGWTIERIAAAWAQLMARLGYTDYLAQGGDWGAMVTHAMGMARPEGLRAIHLNMPVVRPTAEEIAEATPEEAEMAAKLQAYRRTDIGYARIQASRPQTLGYALTDSPIGLAAWIYEKFYFWTDNQGAPEDALSRDRMLDNITLYWLTGSATSAARLYWESFNGFKPRPVTLPTGLSLFPREFFQTSRRWAEKRYTDLRYWNQLDRGGHFAAFEEPDLFVTELRACFTAIS